MQRYDCPVNLWVVVAVVLLGGALALAPAVWSWLDPLSPARSVQRLLTVMGSWNGIRDLDARKVVVRGDDGEMYVRLAFLSPANLRVELSSPSTLAGEVFTLRPVSDGWLFVHYRPSLNLGIETRLSVTDVETALQLPTSAQLADGLRGGRIKVVYAPAPLGDPRSGDQFDIQGLPGGFPRIVLWVDPVSLIPWRVNLYSDPTGTPTVDIEAVREDDEGKQLHVNTGLELRDVLRLHSQPERWLSPTPPSEGQI